MANPLSHTEQRIAQRARSLSSSAIREILKLTERQNMISFAGGIPSSASFPLAALRDASARATHAFSADTFQYSATEGYAPLREWIAREHSTSQHPVAASNVLITSGSQQAFDLIGKVLVDPQSAVLVERPTYLGALQALSLYEPEFVSVQTDERGIVSKALECIEPERAALLYVQPNFQNPTGARLSFQRRRKIAEIAQRTGLIVVEDNPYVALAFDGEQLPAIHSMAPDNVIYLGSFSKVLAPGLRVGYMIVPGALQPKFVQVKQAADLHSSTLSQRIVYETVREGFLETHAPRLANFYRKQSEAMLSALERHMPEGVRWNVPEGGMFIWLALPPGVDSAALLEDALAVNVAFVPGAPFFAHDPLHHFLRLSFATVSPQQIDRGIERLAALINAYSRTFTPILDMDLDR
ncbi:aminotransferase-like domain-containing protein [Paraburkholderia guartelaensis]|uniref:aminotransferase-like domain-containing protein n=1 Tax=Paraburkholderia guartelaensis TaxID=2546446 RepID=UPI002AB70824|nr:PLP-dependent aminotransferase family protein [Paraburkholderia guartelaensis]